jgi:hypothetical protein
MPLLSNEPPSTIRVSPFGSRQGPAKMPAHQLTSGVTVTVIYRKPMPASILTATVRACFSTSGTTFGRHTATRPRGRAGGSRFGSAGFYLLSFEFLPFNPSFYYIDFNGWQDHFKP